MEEVLSGGNMNEVMRAGDTVRRPGGPWTSTVHEVLRRLRLKGIEWVPHAHGIDEVGREVLEFVPGVVPSYPMPPWVWEDSFLVTAASRLREFHDATAGPSIVDAVWQVPVHEPAEVICHNDFAPYNFVCRNGQFAGVIDWDMMSPGPRIWDVAYLAYRLCPLAAPTNPDGCPGDSSEDQGRRLGLLLGSYRAEFTASDALRVVEERLEDLARFTADEAERQNRSDLASHVNLYINDVVYLQTARSASWEPQKEASSSSRSRKRRSKSRVRRGILYRARHTWTKTLHRGCPFEEPLPGQVLLDLVLRWKANIRTIGTVNSVWRRGSLLPGF